MHSTAPTALHCIALHCTANEQNAFTSMPSTNALHCRSAAKNSSVVIAGPLQKNPALSAFSLCSKYLYYCFWLALAAYFRSVFVSDFPLFRYLTMLFSWGSPLFCIHVFLLSALLLWRCNKNQTNKQTNNDCAQRTLTLHDKDSCTAGLTLAL